MTARASRPADTPRPPEYPSRAYVPARPDRLAAVARLHGLDPAPPSKARILELGCGAAVNLLSISSALPDAHCVGVDADPAEIDRGRDLAAAARLSAVELICADLRDVADQVGEADYILVHGVWSWVPDEVRDAIAALCASKLAPQGVALISYNALPGWYTWLPARALARRALRNDQRLGQVATAQGAIDLARRLHGPHQGPYATVLAAALERYERLEPALLLRDDLAECTKAFWLEEVAGHLQAVGLSYLGEAIPEQWWQWRSAHMTAERVRDAAEPTLLARQQFADLASGVDFKATLFVRGTPSLEPDARGIADLHATVTPNRDALPDSGAPAMHHLLAELEAARPGALAISELAARSGLSEESAARAVLRLMAERRVDLHLERPPWATGATERPEVPSLARAQAQYGPELTTLRHDQIALRDPHAQALVALMDGTLDHTALAAELAAQTGRTEAVAGAGVHDFLGQLADLGLLRRSSL